MPRNGTSERARCAGETLLGLRAKDRATPLLAGREVTFRRIGRSYNRTVATVILDGRDLGTELVQIGVAAARSHQTRTGRRILISDLIRDGRRL